MITAPASLFSDAIAHAQAESSLRETLVTTSDLVLCLSGSSRHDSQAG